MTKYKEDLFLMGQRNMQCIVKLKGKEFNRLLYSYIGIKSDGFIAFLQLCFPFLFTANIIGAIILTVIKFCRSSTKAFTRKTKEIPIYDHLFLNFTYMFLERTKAADLFESSKYWVIGPNVDKRFIPSGKIIVDYKEYITFRDCFRILGKALNTIWNYAIYERSLCLVHKVWQFYEAEVGLSKITPNSTIYFSNQSDKYANLLDYIPSYHKVLLQHGIALRWDKLPCPLKNIGTFYSISDKTWQDAYSNILEGKPTLKFFNPTISLTEFNNVRKKVLIISEVTYYKQEVEMLKTLKSIDVEVYLKRHPGFNQDECYRILQKEYNFVYITEKVFPSVNFVVSYFSTLAFEYMALNIPVYMYQDANDFNANRMIEELRKVLE